MAARSTSHTLKGSIAGGVNRWEDTVMWPSGGAADPVIRTQAV